MSLALSGALPAWTTLALIGLVTGLATLSGGLLALALRNRIHLILGFSAGAIVAVALLELLPEAFKTATLYGVQDLATFVALGFFLYLVLDRLLFSMAGSSSRLSAQIGAASLTLHSVLDGAAIGFGFQASETIGLVIAAAVVAHDFSDGINTVNLSLLGAGRRVAYRWLIADALAPTVGLVLALSLHIQESVLGPALAAFAGAFLYIGAGKLIGESHQRHPYQWTTLTSAIGFGAIFLVTVASHD